ncbi:PSD1 and planctomycete cytochrome C domain-containing protein [Aeoliella sp. SH292]|uniref:PSD1 and planctomycete cytochrome C domain-containing protein n=1 Tax=Aeoliella sp. SH292 TaxID=3454464 RepID=UPI003F97DDEC
MMGGRIVRIHGASWLTLVGCLAVVGAASGETRIDYNRQIRPLLSDRCFQCHGPDEATREAGLRLDDREAATSETDSGITAIVPGNVDESEFVARIATSDHGLLMPPAESGKSLNAEEIALLKQWISEGAEYQPHWAFIAPKAIEPPAVSKPEWPRGPIDQFILAKLESEKLTPSPEADRVTLLRRVTLDLTGLPPTPEEVEAYIADESPEAYERLVDRLLASPHYGEHMARYWLDAVRYGDTHGLHLDNYREMWPYRDWVVRAMNSNVPWDRFTLMQIAGDMLPEATLDDQIASGFNRCHVTTNEGGSITEEVHIRNVVDRVSTTGSVFLGLTMGCAVCHDHKFDPISARDFYSMSAYFNNMDGPALDENRADPAPTIKAPTPEQSQKLDELRDELAIARIELSKPRAEVDSQQAIWEDETRKALASGELAPVVAGSWHSIGPFRSDYRYLASRKHGPEGKPVDLTKPLKDSDDVLLHWQPRPEWVDGEVHDDLHQVTSATFLYREFETNHAQTITAGFGFDDGAKVYLNGKLIYSKHGLRAVKPDDEKLKLKLKKGKNELLIKVSNAQGTSGFCFTMPKEADGLPAEVIAALNVSEGERTDEQRARLRQHYRMLVCDAEEIESLTANIDRLDREIVELESAIPTTLVMKERADPLPAYLLLRGDYASPDKELGPLPRAVPSFLPPLPEGASNDRLGFGKWLVSPEHPLMARVTVNRFWQQFFGTGIVETAEDFGSQGAWPSHPELLDWLAVDFREHGWDVKRLVKQLVMSSTYRQSSVTSEELQTRDPRNRLLARGPRYRMDAEVIRDQALAVSGLLVDRLGGPGVKPPQPDGLWEAVAYSGSNTRFFVADTEHEKVHRRSLYTFWKRTSPPPQLTTLDAPSRESCVVRRERTNTPLAALLLLNDPQYVEAARALAERSMLEAAGSADQIAARMLRLAVMREPTGAETERLVGVYQASLDRYQNDSEAASKLLAIGVAPPSDELDRAELAAWTLVANVVLNLDELVTKE